MRVALVEAKTSKHDVPVGCVLTNPEGNVVIRASNTRDERMDLLGHAELNALAATWGTPTHGRLDGYTLVTTLEPCVMCAGAIRDTGIVRVVFGAFNPLKGAAGSIYDLLRDSSLGKQVEVFSGVLAKESQSLLDDFFEGVRKLAK